MQDIKISKLGHLDWELRSRDCTNDTKKMITKMCPGSQEICDVKKKPKNVSECLNTKIPKTLEVVGYTKRQHSHLGTLLIDCYSSFLQYMCYITVFWEKKKSGWTFNNRPKAHLMFHQRRDATLSIIIKKATVLWLTEWRLWILSITDNGERAFYSSHKCYHLLNCQNHLQASYNTCSVTINIKILQTIFFVKITDLWHEHKFMTVFFLVQLL